MPDNEQLLLDRIDRIIERNDDKRSALIQVLLDVQKEKKWLPEEYLLHVSRRAERPPAPRLPGGDVLQGVQPDAPRAAPDHGVHGHPRATSADRRCCWTASARNWALRPAKPPRTTASPCSRSTAWAVAHSGRCWPIDETYYSNPTAAEFDKILGSYE